MTWGYPWALAAPLLYLSLQLAVRLRRRSHRVPAAAFCSAALLTALPVSTRLRLRTPVLSTLLLAVVVLLSIAAARPQRVTLLERPLKGRNIMLVIDVSRSMLGADFATAMRMGSRMDGVKTVVAEYVRNRTGDRVGLVVFGSSAYLQSPLTSDTGLVEELVQALNPGMAGDGTAIGEGLGLALKRLRDVQEGSKAIILMTDGVNNAGHIGPLKAAQVAHELGVQVHTVGIGSGNAPMIDPNSPAGLLFGAHQSQLADFDEATLKTIAKSTNGVYFNARNLDGLTQVYREIEALTAVDHDRPDTTQVQELFPPYALAGLALYLIAVLLNATVFMKVP